MNTLLKHAASTVELGWVAGLMTALFLVFFLGWIVWAYAPSNRARMERAAQLPFLDEGDER
ncbi:MAG: cbb3-type cytochrome c oxidase subunit 3 [Gemmatimonadetes bacterium]|nr:MAG: cbb3-type cytochrome c oxidase subunit 3 [Gemmatimonadota bacterium]